MEINRTTVESVLLSSSNISPCTANEIAIRPSECIEGDEEGLLETEIFQGFRIWHFGGMILSILLSIVIGLCCCIKFRVPRTKQEIEEDYIRRKVTRTFREELSKLNLSKMDEMHLRLAIDAIRNEVNALVYGLQKEDENNPNDRPEESIQAQFNTLFTG
ncbi:hypothetical protein M0802_005120 [Mischocyttarus mexicanus]|nr:hypothetical protein M0802_005120 [Mischocyttarus mexicanus]